MKEKSNVNTVHEKWNEISRSFSNAISLFDKIKFSKLNNNTNLETEDKNSGLLVGEYKNNSKPAFNDAVSLDEDNLASKSLNDNVVENSLGSDWDFLFKNEDLMSTPLEEEKISLISEVDLNQEDDDINEELLPDAIEELEELLPQVNDLLQKLGTKEDNFQELYRLTHTLKGTVGSVGAKKARSIIHVMESAMEEWDNIEHDIHDSKNKLIDLFSQADTLIQPLITGSWVNQKVDLLSDDFNSSDVKNIVKPPRTVRVQADSIDTMVSDVNEGRLLAMALDETVNMFKAKLKHLEESAQHISRMSRDLELQAQIQIQSGKSQNQEISDDFDPLEFDRFTRLQELSKTIGEGVTDVFEIRRDLSKIIMEQEAVMAQQKGSIQSTQENLRKTRLTPADAINDRLHNVVRTSAKELNKDVSFKMTGSRVQLDRVLLEKIIPPLEHILRNSMVHGIESKEKRVENGKPEIGSIDINISQRSDRVLIDVIDDGEGLNVEKIKEKAVEKGLWNSSDLMTDKDAAEIICSQGFSTADTTTTLAGRGVGMDVVRSQILSLGGRFEIFSNFGKGMEINIQLPTSVATSSVLLVNSGAENWAFSIEIVEHVVLLSKSEIEKCRKENKFYSTQFSGWQESPFYKLDDLTGVKSRNLNSLENSPILLLRERDQLMAIEVEKLVQVFEVPLRPSGSIWNDVNGVAGTVILPNGNAVFLLDPFRFTSFNNHSVKTTASNEKTTQIPLIMVVDDSLTVRKASARFLQKNGFDYIEAKDGQDALDLLEKNHPSIILLDIEMPRMDGFDCLRNIRESQNNSIKNIPVIMITSRTADKHKKHAFDLGANEYLGKPFKDNELLDLINKYLSQQNQQ